jgi:hypothetical protein
MLVLVGALGVGFERNSLRRITSGERRELRIRTVGEIARILPEWHLIVKAHPDFGSIHAVEDYLQPLPPNAIVVSPQQPVEPFLPVSDAVLDLPAPNTSTLVTAFSGFREKPIIAADLDRDLLADQYREWTGIEYVEDAQDLSALLIRIRNGDWIRKRVPEPNPDGVREFADTNDAVRFIMDQVNP